MAQVAMFFGRWASVDWGLQIGVDGVELSLVNQCPWYRRQFDAV